MKKIGFIGNFDKIDYIIYIAKILTSIGKKTLIVDATEKQRARYIVPAINPTISYVTEFEGIDISVGFKTLEEIKKYIGIGDNQKLNYDFVLVDSDNYETIKTLDMKTFEKNYFVTSFDKYSIMKGIEILADLEQPMELTKILFSREISKEEDDYLNFVSLGYKIMWDEEKVYFPLENGDLSAIYENQRVEKIKFRKLSTQCVDSLLYITEEMLENVNINELRRAIKNIDKGV